MPVWPYRYQLSLKHRIRRSIYEVLRDQLDGYLMRHALVESYKSFTKAGESYPFVPKRELKPRAKVIEQEYSNQNHFLVIFCEGTIPTIHKKYIRFFDSNKVTKETVSEQMVNIQLHKNYTKNLRHFDNLDFGRFVLDMTPVDYAILIQQDALVKKLNRYVMTHFHVRIDWPIDDATENMAQYLRYTSKELYENGEKYAQSLHHKLFENYGFHHAVGGRRTAAIVASQLLKSMDFISTIYVASAESRSLTRISERGVSKYVLVKLPMADIGNLCEAHQLTKDQFIALYLIDINDEYGVGIQQVVYNHSIYSKPPEDGKLRRLQPDYQWLNITDQLLVPIDSTDVYPLPYSTIYSAE
ncbi:MAG: hypothetical protein ISR96_13000 [Nitrospira sp.]|nr:hypothetical protein [bacterium]MBL7050424.1 hypothetical protein [Nitrospira sp.]